MARRRRRQRKIVTTIGFLFLILAAGLICYLVWDNYFRDKNNDVGKDSQSEQVVKKETDEGKSEESEKQLEEEPKTEELTEDEKEKPNYDGENPNQSSLLTGVVTRAERMNEQVIVRVNIDQYLGEGSCQLNLKKDSDVIYSMTASIVSSAATATCEGFDVPVAEIGGGDFAIEIVVESGEKTGVINGEVNV